MPRPAARTIDSYVVIAGPDWAIDVTYAANAWAVNGTGSHDYAEVMNTPDKEADLFGIGMALALGTLYYGDEAKLLVPHAEDEDIYGIVMD